MDELIRRLLGLEKNEPVPEYDPLKVIVAMGKLSSYEWDIIYSRFGLNNCPLMTISEIATFKNVSPERIRFIEARALRKLRYQLRDILKEATKEEA